MVLAQSCGLRTVASSLALLLGAKENTVRQRLREWSYAKKDKRGVGRCEIDVRQNFVPLLEWIMAWWPAGEKRIALALDATSLGHVFVVLVISVLYRGCAIPIAWHILPEGQKGAWKGIWLELFAHFQGCLSPDWTVIVMADRGLYAHWLWEAIRNCHWHPFLRIQHKFFFRPKDEKDFRPWSRACCQPGSTWSGSGTCFKDHPIAATLLVRWEAGYQDPWLLVTDLSVEQACPCWYALRSWIECGFKHLKRAGWQWHRTRMLDPQRAMRFWLVLAVATLWLLSLGGQADAQLPVSSLETLPANHIARRRISRNAPQRLLSCFHRGWLLILTSLIAQRPLPIGSFLPEPWPT